MGKYKRAPDEIVELVEDCIKSWHEELLEARIGVLLRAEAPASKGNVTLGKSKKMPDDMRPYVDYDFVIWFAEDYWRILTEEQRTALVDHELCHCRCKDGEIFMVDHDVMEFNAVLARHGFWWPRGEKTRDAVQPHFEFVTTRGGVEAMDPASFNEEDVLDQVDGVLKKQQDARGAEESE